MAGATPWSRPARLLVLAAVLAVPTIFTAGAATAAGRKPGYSFTPTR